MTRYYAVAGRWTGSTYTLLVLRRDDGHEVWGDNPLNAARWADIPTVSTERLARTPYRVVGDWTEVNGTWRADVA